VAPATGDDVNIIVDGTYTVTLDVNATVNVLVLGGISAGTETLSVGAGNTLTVNGTSGVTTPGVLLLNGGTLSGSGTLSVYGKVTWNGGTMNGSGTTDISTSGTLTVNSASSVTLNRPLTSSGIINWVSGYISWQTGASITNSGTFDVQGNNNMDAVSSGRVFTNMGTFKKTVAAATGTAVIGPNIQFNNSGTGSVLVEHGALSLQGGGTHNGSFNASLPGTAGGYAYLQFAGGIHDINSSVNTGSTGTVYVTGGTVNVNGSWYVSDQTNLSGGTTNFNNPYPQLGSCYINNAGTMVNFNVDASLATTTLNNGTLSVASGKAVTLNSTFAWNGGALSGSGTFTSGSTGSLSLATAADKTIDGLSVSNGGSMQWTGGNLILKNGASLTNQTGWTFECKGDLSLQGGGGTTSAFTNNGTFRRSTTTGIASITGVTFTNTTYATVDVQSGTFQISNVGTTNSDGIFQGTSGTVLQFSAGTMNLLGNIQGDGSGGAPTVQFDGATVISNGTYNLTGGSTKVLSGSLSCPGAVLSVGDSLTVTGGTADFGSANLSVTTLALGGGTLKNSGSLTPTEGFDWTGGTLGGTGSTTIGNAVVASLTGATAKGLDGRSLTNAAPVAWSGGNLLLSNNAVWTNQTGSTLDCQGDLSILLDAGIGASVSNSGTLKKSGGGTLTLGSGVSLSNSGLVDVQSGTLKVAGGGTNSGTIQGGTATTLQFSGGIFGSTGVPVISGPTAIFDGATVSHSGTYNITGSTTVSAGSLSCPGTVTSVGSSLTVSGGAADFGSANISVATLTLGGGVLRTSGTLTPTTTFDWSGGVLGGSGSTDIGAGLTVSMTTGSDKTLDARTLNNYGTMNWSAGNLLLNNGAKLSNLSGASLNCQGDLLLDSTAGTGMVFDNQGTFTKSAGPGTTATHANVAVSNGGTFDIQSGTLYLQGPFSNFTSNTLTNGSYLVKGVLKFTGANIATNAASILLDGATASVVDQTDTGAFLGLSQNVASSSIGLQNGASLATASAFSNVGSVSIGNGSTFSLTSGGYTQSGSGTTTVNGALSVAGGNTVTLSGGTLSGTGTVSGNVSNAATLNPGTSPGTLSITGTYSQTATGTFNAEIAGISQLDILNVSGAATLNGTLNVSLLGGYVPNVNDAFQILSFASRTGNFATVNGLNIGGGKVFEPQFAATNLRLYTTMGGGIVTTTADAVPGSLRAAINYANANPDTTVTFNIPTADSGYNAMTGVFTLQPTTGLPAITAAGTIIDGSTQTTFTGNTNTGGPEVIINGASAGNVNGMELQGANGIVKNLVVNGFQGSGVSISGSAATGNTVQGNFIGTNSVGTAGVPHGICGVQISAGAQSNTIGGTGIGEGNVVSGNQADGVRITGTGTTTNLIQGNRIGVQADGVSTLGNLGNGVMIDAGAQSNEVGPDNTIANNGVDGVRITGIASTSNIVTQNTISNSASMGIDLQGDGVTANDTGDADTGPNGLQNFPVIHSVLAVASTTITGTIDTPNPGSAILEFFQNDTADLSGNGEGQVYLGSGTPNSDGTFSVTIAAIVPNGKWVTATATDASGNTSEFSVARQMGSSAWTVTHTGDSGFGSLREAINYANGNPGTIIAFNIPGTGPHTIQPAAPLPTITGFGTTIDGTTEPDYVDKPVIEIDGTNAGTSAVGLRINASSCVVKGLCINRFGGDGIFVQGSNSDNAITGNRIGTNINGNAASANGGNGILLSGSSNNTIGGTSVAVRNVISGNMGSGVKITGSSASGNVLQGNYIGTDVSGAVALVNGFGGVRIDSGMNVIGGSVSGAGNIISGNTGVGVYIDGLNGDMSNTIRGNYIGVDKTGGVALGNTTEGIVLSNAMGTTVGGSSTLERNVVSGNQGAGVQITGSSASSNMLSGNYIGVNASGANALPNGADGITMESGASGNIVGGATAGEKNVISGNTLNGVTMAGAGTSNNQIQNNLIGVKADGSAAMKNLRHGVNIAFGATSNTIGKGNLISGNGINGILLGGSGVSSNVVWGNKIGTNATGTSAIPNTVRGIEINTGASNNTIGGSSVPEQNLISGNAADGVLIDGSGTNDNQLYGNRIGTQADGTSALGNGGSGVAITGSASNTLIGDAAAGGNTIAYNAQNGVGIGSGLGHRITFCNIFANGGLGIDLGMNGVTANDAGDADTGPNNLQNFPVIHSVVVNGSSTTVGGLLDTPNPTSTSLEFFRNSGADSSGNGEGQEYLGSGAPNADGTFDAILPVSLANGEWVTATATDTNGNTSEFSAARQVGAQAWVVTHTGDIGFGSLREAIAYANTHAGTTVSFNIPGAGPHVISPSSSLPVVTATGAIIDASTQPGYTGPPLVQLDGGFAGASHGLTVSGSGCTIKGLSVTGFDGTAIQITGDNNVVQSCVLGVDPSGNSAPGNTQAGVHILNAAGNTLGGTIASTRNVIAGNESQVKIEGASAANNTVTGNFLGTNATGMTDIGTDMYGVWMLGGAHDNTVGGSTAGVGNVISGLSEGVRLEGAGTSGNAIQGNFIGVQVDEITPLGNASHGVHILNSASNNTIGTGIHNVIANNGGDGVRVVSGTGNRVLANQIYANVGLGIDLGGDGVTTNEAGDTDIGPNNLMNFPVITSINMNPATNKVSGTIDTGASGPVQIDLFLDDVADPSGYGEGKNYIGSATVSAGSWFLTPASPVPSDKVLTATATDANGNTSEFSQARETTPPTANGASAGQTGSGYVKVIFSEDMNATDAANLSNFTVESPTGTLLDLSSATATYGAATYTVTINSSVNVTAGNTFKVTVVNLRDIAGNAIAVDGTSNVASGVVDDEAPPTVVSSKADNVSSSVEVVFSENVNLTDATTKANFALESPAGTAVDLSPAGITLAYDAATFTTTIAGTTLKSGDTYRITVTHVKDTAGNVIVANDTTNIASGTVSDVVPPTVVSSSADNSTSSVQLTFSENVNLTDATTKANFALESPAGTAVDLTSTTLTYDSATFATTIGGTTLTAGNSYKVILTNVKDLANNAIVDNGETNVSSGTVLDVVGPTVIACDAAQTGSGYGKITFSEEVLATTATNRSNYQVSQDGAPLDLSTAVFEYDAATKTVKLSGQGVTVRSGKTVEAIVRNVKDMVGNPIVADGVGNVCSTVCRDEEPPTVVGSRADNSSASVQVRFSEDVNVTDAATRANFALESPEGTSVSLASVSFAYDAATFTTTIGGTTLKGGDTYKITVTNVKDTAGNPMMTDGAANVSSGTVLDVLPPKVTGCGADNARITVTFGNDESGLSAGTVTNARNYELHSPADSATPIDLSGATFTFDSAANSVSILPLSLHNGDGFRVRITNVADNSENVILDNGSSNVCAGTIQLAAGATLRVVGGNEQKGVAGEELTDPLEVEVVVPAMISTGAGGEDTAPKTVSDQPVPGVDVVFSIKEGKGTFVATPDNPTTRVVRTDATGRASVRWILGEKTGTNIAEATAPDIADSLVSFTATAQAGEPSIISLGASPSEASQGGQSRITATVTDRNSNRVPNTPLKFEVIAGQGALDNGSSRETAATLSTGEYGVAEIDLLNIGYGSNKVQVSDAREPAPENPVASQTVEIVGKFTISLCQGLNLVGVPFTFSNPDPANIFGVPANELRLAGWSEAANNDAGDYIFYSGSNYTVQPGQGFWVRRQDSSDLSIASGTEVDSSQEFVIPIGNGYQIIGNPFAVDIPWDLTNIRIRQNGVDKGDLKTNGVPGGAYQQTSVDPYAWMWNCATQAYNLVFDPLFIAEVPDTLRSTMRSALPVGAGAWYRSNKPGVELVLPAQPVDRSAVTASRNIASRKADEQHWGVELIAEAVTPERNATTVSLRSAGNIFGVLDSGLLRNRGLQLAKPPLPVSEDGSFVDLAFAGRENQSSGLGGQYAWDLRPAQLGVEALGTASWRFTVGTNLKDTEIRVTYPNLSAVPKEYRLYLIDEATNRKQALRTTTGYTFRSQSTPQTVRHFRLEVTKLPGSRLRIANFSAGSSELRNLTSGLRISFSLSQTAQAQLRIRAASGRVMYAFPMAELRAGLNTAQWDGRNALGAYVPRGVYIIELIASNDFGEQVKAVRTVRVH